MITKNFIGSWIASPYRKPGDQINGVAQWPWGDHEGKICSVIFIGKYEDTFSNDNAYKVELQMTPPCSRGCPICTSKQSFIFSAHTVHIKLFDASRVLDVDKNLVLI